MAYLPPEIVLEVLKDFSKPDLKTARVVCKSWNVLATGKLFHRAYASIHREDLDVLKAISSHPTISLAVREVVYTSLYFQYHETEYVPCHHAHVLNQEHIRNTGEDLAIITAALALMPNVSKVIITNSDVLPLFVSSPFLRAPCHDRSFRLRPVHSPLLNENGVPFDYGFVTMCKALALSHTQIESFVTRYFSDDRREIGSEEHGDGIPLSTLALTPRELQYYREALRGVRRWELTLDCFRGFGAFETDNVDLLAEAADIERVDLVFRTNLNLQHPLGTHTWNNLRFLGLTGLYITKAKLVGFFQRHCKTLKTVKLTNIKLKEGSWEEAAVRLRKLNWRALRSFKCDLLTDSTHRIWDGVSGKTVERCVLGREYGSFLYSDIINDDEETYSSAEDNSDEDEDAY